MARTTDTAVDAILGDNFAGTGVYDLTAFIESASAVVDSIVACALLKGVVHSDATLEVMERWLAAHFYTISDPLYTSKSTGSASGSFMQRSFLDVAKALDTTGCLTAVMAGVQKPRMTWLGKPPSSQTAYQDRN